MIEEEEAEAPAPASAQEPKVKEPQVKKTPAAGAPSGNPRAKRVRRAAK